TLFFLLSRLLPFFFGATGLFCGLTFGFFALRLRLGGPFAFGLLLCSLLLCLTLFLSLAGGLGGGCACSLFCGLLLCDPGVERLDQTIRAVLRSGGDIQSQCRCRGLRLDHLILFSRFWASGLIRSLWLRAGSGRGRRVFFLCRRFRGVGQVGGHVHWVTILE